MSDLFDALAPGTRVVVRYRLPAGAHASDPLLSDALGEFLGVHMRGGERFITVRTRRGEVPIRTDTVTHAKPVPPPPPRRRPLRGAGGTNATD